MIDWENHNTDKTDIDIVRKCNEAAGGGIFISQLQAGLESDPHLVPLPPLRQPEVENRFLQNLENLKHYARFFLEDWIFTISYSFNSPSSSASHSASFC